MKKNLMFVLIVLMGFALVACGESDTDSLKLYNWGEYIDDELVEAFETESGIKVKQIAFDSNEVAITQIKAGNKYDLVIPSDYAIEQLALENLIQPINWDLITTFDKDVDLADGLATILAQLNSGDDAFDLLNYAVPYFWGNVGILYDTTTVNEADLTGWDALTNPNYEIAFYNSARDAYMIALKTIDADLNAPTVSEMTDAKAWLTAALTSQTYVITDEIFDAMLDPARYDMAVAYSGDANYLMMENENLSFFVPEEGTNIWVDGFVVPQGADEDKAYAFINFMMTYEHAAQNTEYVGYSTPRKDVFEEMLEAGGTYEDYAASYNVRINENDQVYRYNSTLKRQMDTEWQQILASKGYSEEGLGIGAYLAIGIVIILVSSSAVFAVIKKRRKVI
ncbi:MAG: ABC transporter substrate-binding protein [Acholeplasmataceae bacterium]|jgi:spermidine/putrescine transport system substrate-binding protein|nr:ABC transporter substrate-binding protein [Acholeplasmataceae bacterium]